MKRLARSASVYEVTLGKPFWLAHSRRSGVLRRSEVTVVVMLKPEAWVRYGGLTLLDDWTRETQLFIVEKAFFRTSAQVRNANVTYIDPDVTFDLWSHQSPVDWNRTAEDQDNSVIAWTSHWRQQRDRHLHLQRAERERHVKVSWRASAPTLQQHTCLWLSSSPEHLDQLLQGGLIGVGAEIFRMVALQEHGWRPLLLCIL